MNQKKTGGQAFPTSDGQAAHGIAVAALNGIEDTAERDRVYTEVRAQAQQGMSLRDYFAAQALPAILAQEGDGVSERAPSHKMADGTPYVHWWAKCAYELADAMLAERAK